MARHFDWIPLTQLSHQTYLSKQNEEFALLTIPPPSYHQILRPYYQQTLPCAYNSRGAHNSKWGPQYIAEQIFKYWKLCKFDLFDLDVGVRSVASYCPQLRELSLSECPNVGDKGVAELSQLGPSLRYLSVAKCSDLSDYGLRWGEVCLRRYQRICYNSN